MGAFLPILAPDNGSLLPVRSVLVSAALAVAVIATSGLAIAPSSASAAGLARIAPIETSASQATQVGYYYGGGYGYGYHYRPHCFWTKRKVWGYYGHWHWERFRVCR